MPKGLRRVVFNAPSGGVNYTNDVFAIGQNQCRVLRNCHLDGDGHARTRLGNRLLNPLSPLAGPVTSIYDYHRPYGPNTDTMVLVTAGRALYRYDGTTFNKLTDLKSSDRPTWATFQDGSAAPFAFMANGTDFIKYNGEVVSDVATGEDAYPWVSAPRYIVEYDDRLVAAGCDSDPYKIFVSESLNGTNWWPGLDSTPSYWGVKGQRGDKVSGLARIYDFLAIFQETGISIITEADPSSSTSQQIQVSDRYGTTSHWSIQTVGATVYFADRTNIYRAVLRDTIENGLTVYTIGDNVRPKYMENRAAGDVTSVYSPEYQELVWSIQTGSHDYRDTALTYSLALSGNRSAYAGAPVQSVWQDVWSGWSDGIAYRPYTLGLVQMDDEKLRVWSGDEDGYVRVQEETYRYKDQRPVDGVATDVDVTTEIVTGPLAPYGMTMNKVARQFTPTMFQRTNGSTRVQWVIDGAYVHPDTNRYVELTGLVPYYSDGSDDALDQLWGNTVWQDEPYTPQPIGFVDPFRYIQFRIINDGTATQDGISYGGAELWYQLGKIGRQTG